MIETTVLDPAEVLDTPGAEAEFIAAAFESGDAAHITNALGIVARARGMTNIAREAGVTRRGALQGPQRQGQSEGATRNSGRLFRALGVELSARAA